jgi:UDP-GlcNAc:undecaprenyl-phosphate GlcNAc-1-phosphate transferase
VALVATPGVRAAARRLGVLDHALSSRKVHGRPVPRLGGLAIVAAFYAPLVGFLFLDTSTGRLFWSQLQRALALILGGLAMASLGAWDDLRGAGARTKLAVEVLVAVAMWWAGYRIDAVATPFGTLELGILGQPFTVLWIVGITNALNLADGLAAGIGLLAASAIFWVAFRNHRPLMMLFMACLGGGLLGFLRYNFNPASIFMGDSGSLFVGFVLAATGPETHEKSTTTVALLVPIVALSVPIGDTLLAMTRRAVRGQPVFSSDRGHIHHRLIDRGLSHRATVLALYGLATVVAFVAVGLVRADVEQTVAYFGVLLTIGVMLLASTRYVRFDQTRQVLSDRKHNLAMRAAARLAGDRIRHAEAVEEVWEAAREAATELGACCVSLVVVTRNGTRHRSEFS